MLSVNVNLPVTVLNKGDVAMWLPWWWWWWWWWCDGWRPLWRGGMSDIHLDDRRQPRLIKLSFLFAFCLLPICIFAYLPIICVSSTYMCATNHITDPLHGQLISVFFAEFHIEMKCWALCLFHSVCNVAPAPYLKSYQIEIWQFGEFNIGIGSRCRCNQWISVNGVEFETPIGLEPQTRAQFNLFLKYLIKFLSLY